MRKKIIAFLLVAAIVVGIAPLMSLAAEGDTVTAMRAEYIYSLSADPDTGTVPDGFGTISNNGRIWTDKSVDIVDDSFNVNLKVLAQEYISSFGTTETQSIAADVLFILDFTGSMTQNGNVVVKDDGTTVSRLKAMVDAANEAIEIITETNPNNRIKMVRFSGNSTNCDTYTKEIMPLAHYTSSSNSTDTVDKYIRLSATSTVASSNTLLKDGESFTFSEKTQNGTCTQYGIVKGVQSFIDDINAETDNSIERRPYVIMLTDGEPTLASKNWNSENLRDLRTDTISTNSGTSGDSNGGDRPELMATGAILSASLWRDKLADAYEEYNNNGKEIDVQWFNIGLGIAEPADDDSANYTACLLNPYYMVGVEGKNGTGATSREKIKHYMGQSDWAPKVTEKDYSADGNYTYINEGDGYVTFANTYSVLMNAFVTLANIIKMGSMEYTVPIVNHEGSGTESSDVQFTDVIGEGMFITDISLTQNGKPPVTGTDDDGDGVYSFRGYNTTVTITKDQNGQQTLVWNIPANEVAMFTFADREDVGNGEYVSAEPTVLTYGVDFTDEIETGPAYTNAFDSNNNPLTTVTYEIPGDNDYYFDVVKDELHNFVSSTMKTGLDGSTQKTENVTSSAPDSHSYAYTAVNNGTVESSATVSGTLGNNGKVTFLSRKENLEITVEKIWQDSIGNTIENTSSFPPVGITLLRKAENSETEETVRYITLSDSNDYSETLTLPIRDGNNNRYTYYINEDCPEGYFIAGYSPALVAKDGKLTVTNREFPEEGIIAVRKVWKNKIGAAINDSSMLSPVTVNLKRHVLIKTPVTHTVTISCSDNVNNNLSQYARTVEVPDGTEISFVLRTYIRSNYNSATISLGDDTISSTAYQRNNDVAYTGATVNINNRWCRETVTQTFTVTADLNLNYVVNNGTNGLNTRDFPRGTSPNIINPYMVRDWSETPPDEPNVIETQVDDELYESVTLNSSNGWQKVFDDLPLAVPGDEGETYNYKYFIEEISDIPGFTASYSANNTNGVEGGLLTVTNTSTSNITVLPETGGRGSPPVVLTGALTAMIATAIMFFGLSPGRRKKRKRII